MGTKYCRINGFKGIALFKKRASKVVLQQMDIKFRQVAEGRGKGTSESLNRHHIRLFHSFTGKTSSRFDTARYKWHISFQAFILKYQLEP